MTLKVVSKRLILEPLITVINSALDLKLLNLVVSQAKTWGFICQCQESNLWQINPQQTSQKWQLKQVEDRWILSVKGVPQLRLDPEGAIAFLESRRLENN